MKAIKNIESYEIRDEVQTMWEANRKAILQTTAVVVGVAIVATAFFLGRTRMLNALVNSQLYKSGLELSHKLADKALVVKDKVLETAERATHAFAERAHVSGLN